MRIDHIGQGIGARLLQVAEDHSAGRLWLYTFARIGAAWRFYVRHGFVEVAFGFEPIWQLDDGWPEWVAATAAPSA